MDYYFKRKAPPPSSPEEDSFSDPTTPPTKKLKPVPTTPITSPISSQKESSSDSASKEGIDSNDKKPTEAEIQDRIKKNREAALQKLQARKKQDEEDAKKGRFLGRGLEPTWKSALQFTMNQPYFRALESFLLSEQQKGKTIYPSSENIFSAFNHCSLKKLKVVIIGQDPYHGPNQAHGMCFSVQRGIRAPPSLLNIYQELKNDIPGFVSPKHGCLESWANQGVFLLNTILTVEKGRPASHRGKGWETFTQQVIEIINRRKKGVVFLLWGGHAKGFQKKVGKSHFVLTAAHPSPLSANKPYGGWFGCKHFSKANAILKKEGKKAIDWNLPE